MIKKQNQIIDKELEYWKKAYPGQAALLEKFAQKIKLELDLQSNGPLSRESVRETKEKKDSGVTRPDEESPAGKPSDSIVSRELRTDSEGTQNQDIELLIEGKPATKEEVLKLIEESQNPIYSKDLQDIDYLMKKIIDGEPFYALEISKAKYLLNRIKELKKTTGEKSK